MQGLNKILKEISCSIIDFCLFCCLLVFHMPLVASSFSGHPCLADIFFLSLPSQDWSSYIFLILFFWQWLLVQVISCFQPVLPSVFVFSYGSYLFFCFNTSLPNYSLSFMSILWECVSLTPGLFKVGLSQWQLPYSHPRWFQDEQSAFLTLLSWLYWKIFISLLLLFYNLPYFFSP